jgi:5-methylcytosine-specific restriction endonuclease McrA
MSEIQRIAEQKEKARQRAAEWRRRNLGRVKRTPEQEERNRQRALRYYYEHREACMRKKAEWDREHSEERRERNRRTYAVNPEPLRSRKRRYYERHKAEVKAKTVKWQKANPERFLENNRASDSNKRASRYRAPGRIAGSDIRDLLQQQNESCAICRKPFPAIGVLKRYEVDHVIALSVGGPNERTNIQLLCSKCNRYKGVKATLTITYQESDVKAKV